jgi:hypothetical protein
MKSTIDMAREAGFVTGSISYASGVGAMPIVQSVATSTFLPELERFADLVRADERWEQSKRRGVLAFCPYTGRPRHPSDIASDPHGILILVPDQPLRAAKKDGNA